MEARHPGAILKERYLDPLGITASRLARSLDLPLSRVVDLIDGRCSITPDLAARLALFFDVPPDWWLFSQARYDAANLAPVEALREVVEPYDGLSDVLVTPEGVRRLSPSRTAPEATSSVGFSPDFLARLRAQAALDRAQTALDEDPERTVYQTILDDGTLALTGK